MTVRPIHALLGIMLLCLTAAAAPFEGLTATYRDKENGNLLVVEVSADGRARITESDGSYSLIIGKLGYDVGPGPVSYTHLLPHRAAIWRRRGGAVPD